MTTPDDALSLRRAEQQDLDTVIEILEEAATWLASRDIPQWFPGEFRNRAHEFAQFIADGEMYLARIGQINIGTFHLTAHKRQGWRDRAADAL
ncbi:MAG: hypothetical protein GEU73_11445 [Chloroflexi bacterium]|nr:hypothetical protein [Chloroflexota bacterium]